MRILLGSALALGIATGSAEATTCSFDGGTGVATVTMTGTLSTLRVAAGGVIQLDNVACGAATTSTTSQIVVDASGTSVRNQMTFTGKFAPGRNDVPETDLPEIEIQIVGFTNDNDDVVVNGTGGADTWVFTAGGVNFNGDLDEDLTVAETQRFTLRGLGGDDTIDAHAYKGIGLVILSGQDGNDVLTGTSGDNVLDGDAGNDTLRGRAGNDTIHDGPGNDMVLGGPGDDRMISEETVANGADDFKGNDGIDEVSYIVRGAGVTVTIDNVADDGEPGEGDNVHLDVENLTGGQGDDLLIGSRYANEIDGSRGSNEVHGGRGDDFLNAGIGGVGTLSMVFGEEGNDELEGSGDDDFLDGGPGSDFLEGFGGNDTLDGGGGTDQYFGGLGDDVLLNADGFAETVDCGDGTDDAEPSGLDTFVGCENI